MPLRMICCLVSHSPQPMIRLCSVYVRILPVEDGQLGRVLIMFSWLPQCDAGRRAVSPPPGRVTRTVEAARLGTATLLRDDRILRIMIVRNAVPPAFVEWAER